MIPRPESRAPHHASRIPRPASRIGGASVRIPLTLALCATLFTVALKAQSPDAMVRRILDSSQFKDSTSFIQNDQSRFVQELITLTEIPAPPFKEQQRAK